MARNCGVKAGLFSVLLISVLLAGCGKNQRAASTAPSSSTATEATGTAAVSTGTQPNQPSNTPVAQAPVSQSAAPQTANAYPPIGQPATAQPATGTPVASTGAPAPSYPQQAQVQAPVETYNIPFGTLLRVRIDRTVDTKHDHAGEGFTATLNTPVTVDGRVAIPRGTLFTGHLTYAAHSGRFKGRAVIGLTLDSFTMDNEAYRIDTGSDVRSSKRHRKRNFLFIGGGAGGGAAIGAAAGGGAGALIGAGAGAVAGATTAFFTGRKNISVPAETLLTFRLRQSVDVTQQEASVTNPSPGAASSGR